TRSSRPSLPLRRRERLSHQRAPMVAEAAPAVFEQRAGIDRSKPASHSPATEETSPQSLGSVVRCSDFDRTKRLAFHPTPLAQIRFQECFYLLKRSGAASRARWKCPLPSVQQTRLLRCVVRNPHAAPSRNEAPSRRLKPNLHPFRHRVRRLAARHS